MNIKNEKMIKKKEKILGGLIIILMTFFTACGMYSTRNMIKYAKDELEKKYGEEFEIEYIYDTRTSGSFKGKAYPVNNKDMKFGFWIQMDGSFAYDGLIFRIVGSQYEAVIKEMIKNEFDVESYIHLVPGVDNDDKVITDTSITIDEYEEMHNYDRSSYRTKIYISYKALSFSDEELYKFFGSLNGEYGLVTVLFVTDYDLSRIENEYIEKGEIKHALYQQLDEEYSMISNYGETKHGYVIHLEDEEYFYEQMEEVRKNELF